jgi:putative colanic acid biosynthesis acetyltransferase WcaF
VTLGARVTVSQYSFLCTASHDATRRSMPLITAPITIHADAWITADVFIGPGVTVGEGAMVIARSTVTRSVPPWTVIGGNPARPRGMRHMRDD